LHFIALTLQDISQAQLQLELAHLILVLFVGGLLGKNRDRVSIVAAILEAANLGASKTRIMFGANLSFSLLEKYLGVVLDADFVRVEDSRYVLTEHGREFLKQYRRFQERYVGAMKLLEALACEGRSWL
jgi:predicted transcriptional regulator